MNMRALKLIGLSLLCAAALAQASLAQSDAKPAQSGANHPVEGTYSVTANSAELGAVNFVLILKRDGGKWTGEVKDSPTPLTITSINIDDTNKMTIAADAGGTAVTINGKFDNGEFAGDWSAGDIKGTWKGAKKDASAAAAKPASKPAKPEDLAALEGTYEATITAEGQGSFPFTLVIKRKGDKLVTEVPNAGDLNIVGIEVKEGDDVMLSATFQGNPFQLPGKRTGNEMGGKWAAGGFSGDWSAKQK
ncbi:MAG TPA: hypothetical protein VG324_18315 [Blastocatellia bacterium]|nr:hypothetical protein [Blastocatellia bacterium]